METKRKFITALSNMTMLKAPKVFSARAKRATIALLTAAAMLITPLGGIGPFFALEAQADPGDVTLGSPAYANTSGPLSRNLRFGEAGTVTYDFSINSADNTDSGARVLKENTTYNVTVKTNPGGGYSVISGLSADSITFGDYEDGDGEDYGLSGDLVVTIGSELKDPFVFGNAGTTVEITLSEDGGSGDVAVTKTVNLVIDKAPIEITAEGDGSYTTPYSPSGIDVANLGLFTWDPGVVNEGEPVFAWSKVRGGGSATLAAATGLLTGITVADEVTVRLTVAASDPYFVVAADPGAATNTFTIEKNDNFELTIKEPTTTVNWKNLNTGNTYDTTELFDFTNPLYAAETNGVATYHLSDAGDANNNGEINEDSGVLTVNGAGAFDVYVEMAGGTLYTEATSGIAKLVVTDIEADTLEIDGQDPDPAIGGVAYDEADNLITFDIIVDEGDIGELIDATTTYRGRLIPLGDAPDDEYVDLWDTDIELTEDNNLTGTFGLTLTDEVPSGLHRYRLELIGKPGIAGNKEGKVLGSGEFTLSVSEGNNSFPNGSTANLDISFKANAEEEKGGMYEVTLTGLTITRDPNTGQIPAPKDEELEYGHYPDAFNPAVETFETLESEKKIDWTPYKLASATATRSFEGNPGDGHTVFVRYARKAATSTSAAVEAGPAIWTIVHLPDGAAAPETVNAVNPDNTRNVVLLWDVVEDKNAAGGTGKGKYVYSATGADGKNIEKAIPVTVTGYEYRVNFDGTDGTAWYDAGAGATLNGDRYRLEVPSGRLLGIGGFTFDVRAKNSVGILGEVKRATSSSPITLNGTLEIPSPSTNIKIGSDKTKDVEFENQIGATLTATVVAGTARVTGGTTVNTTPTLSYEWFADGVSVQTPAQASNDGVDENTYEIKAADAGKVISVKIKSTSPASYNTVEKEFVPNGRNAWSTVPYNVALDEVGNDGPSTTAPTVSDRLSLLSDDDEMGTGEIFVRDGGTVTIWYDLASMGLYNSLQFSAVNRGIVSVSGQNVVGGSVVANTRGGTTPVAPASIENKTVTYRASKNDAEDGTITIKGTFTHSATNSIQVISFANAHVSKVYGDDEFTITATANLFGSGYADQSEAEAAITYRTFAVDGVPDESIAEVSTAAATKGLVTIKGTGTVGIRATLDDATAEYVLHIAEAPLSVNLLEDAAEAVKYIAGTKPGEGYVLLTYQAAAKPPTTVINPNTPALLGAVGTDRINIIMDPFGADDARQITDSLYVGYVDFGNEYDPTYSRAKVLFPEYEAKFTPDTLAANYVDDDKITKPFTTPYYVDASKVKSVSVGAQETFPVFGTAGEAQFRVTTTEVPDGEYAVKFDDLPADVGVKEITGSEVSTDGGYDGTINIQNNEGYLTLVTTETTEVVEKNENKLRMTLKVIDEIDDDVEWIHEIRDDKQFELTIEPNSQNTPKGDVNLTWEYVPGAKNARGTYTVSMEDYVTVPNTDTTEGDKNEGAPEYAIIVGRLRPLEDDDWKTGPPEVTSVPLGGTAHGFIRFGESGDENTAPSAAISSSVRLPVEPGMPGDLVATPRRTTQTDTTGRPGTVAVDLSWTAPMDGAQNATLNGVAFSTSRPDFGIEGYIVTYYDVEDEEKESAETEIVYAPQTGGNPPTTTTITDLIHGVEYEFVVKAINSDEIAGRDSLPDTAMIKAEYKDAATISIINKIGDTIDNRIDAKLVVDIDNLIAENIDGVVDLEDSDVWKYEWLSDGVSVAKTAEYTIKATDVGKVISVVVTHEQINGSRRVDFDPDTTGRGRVVPYTIKLHAFNEVSNNTTLPTNSDIRFNALTAPGREAETTGRAGGTVNVNYKVERATFDNNRILFNTSSGLDAINIPKVASSAPAEGTVVYTVNPAAARNGVITIRANFTQTNDEIQEIAFADEFVDRTYGDTPNPFTNPLSTGAGAGAITYTSSNPSVAIVNASTGEVTVLNATTGTNSVTIMARKARDAAGAATIYAAATATYELTVAPKAIEVLIDPEKSLYVASNLPGKGTVSLAYQTAGTTTVYLDESAIEFRRNTSTGAVLATKDAVTYPMSGTTSNANLFGTVNVVSDAAPVIIKEGEMVLAGAQAANYKPVYTPFNVNSTKVKGLSAYSYDRLVYGGEAVTTGPEEDRFDHSKAVVMLITDELLPSRAAAPGVTPIAYEVQVSNLPDGVTYKNAAGVKQEVGAWVPVTIDEDGEANLTLDYDKISDADGKMATVTIKGAGGYKIPNIINANGTEGTDLKSTVWVEIEKREMFIKSNTEYHPNVRRGQGTVSLSYVGNAPDNYAPGLDESKFVGTDDLRLGYFANANTGDIRNDIELEKPTKGVVDPLRPSVLADVILIPEGYSIPGYYAIVDGPGSVAEGKAKNYWLNEGQYVDSTVFVQSIELDKESATIRAGQAEDFEVNFNYNTLSYSTFATTKPSTTEISWSTPYFEGASLPVVAPTLKDSKLSLRAVAGVSAWQAVELQANYQDAYLATALVDVIPADSALEVRLLNGSVSVNRAMLNGGSLQIRANMPIEKSIVTENDVDKAVGVKLFPVGSGTDGVLKADAKESADFRVTGVRADNGAIFVSSTDTISTERMSGNRKWANTNVEVWILPEGGEATDLTAWKQAGFGSTNAVTLRPTISYPSVKFERAQLNRFFQDSWDEITATDSRTKRDVSVVGMEMLSDRLAPRVVDGVVSVNQVIVGSIKSGSSAKVRATVQVSGYKPTMLRAYNTTFGGNKFDATVSISNAKPSLALGTTTLNMRPHTDAGRDVPLVVNGRNSWTIENMSRIEKVELHVRNGNTRTAYSGSGYDSVNGFSEWDLDDGKITVEIPGSVPLGNYSLIVSYGTGNGNPIPLNFSVKNPKYSLRVSPSTISVSAKNDWRATIKVAATPVNLMDYRTWAEDEAEPFDVWWQDGRTRKELSDHPYLLGYGTNWSSSEIYVDLDTQALAAATNLKRVSIPIRITNAQKNNNGVRTTNVVSATIRIEPGSSTVSLKSSGRISAIDPLSKMSYRVSLANTNADALVYDDLYSDGTPAVRVGTFLSDGSLEDSKDFYAVRTGATSFDVYMNPTTPSGSSTGAKGYGYGYVEAGKIYELDWEMRLDNWTVINSRDNASGNNKKLRINPNRPSSTFSRDKDSVTLYNRSTFKSEDAVITLTNPKFGDYEVMTFAGSRGVTRLANGTIRNTNGFLAGTGIEVTKGGVDTWTVRLLNRAELKRANGNNPASSYTLKLEAWPLGTYLLDESGLMVPDANGRPQPMGKSVKPTNVNLKVNIVQ